MGLSVLALPSFSYTLLPFGVLPTLHPVYTQAAHIWIGTHRALLVGLSLSLLHSVCMVYLFACMWIEEAVPNSSSISPVIRWVIRSEGAVEALPDDNSEIALSEAIASGP